MGGWFNLNEVVIRRERDNNAHNSLRMVLILHTTPLILYHVSAKLALQACHSRKIVFATMHRHKQAYFPTRPGSALFSSLNVK